jgi:hypothetical protein
MLRDAFHDDKAMTQKEFLRTVQERHESALTKEWVHALIGRHLNGLQVCWSLPQEDLPMAVPRAYLDERIHFLAIHLTGKVAKLVFNLDEVGSADYEDRKTTKVIAPAAVSRKMCIISHLVATAMRHYLPVSLHRVTL